MTVDVKMERSVFAASDLKRFAGYFVRWQGQYGSIAVVGQLNQNGLDIISNPKRLFPRDGLVEIQRGGQHGDLHQGEWVEFDVIKNTRFRAPAFKALHLKRLPRFAVLPESTLSIYRDLLTRDGWSGDTRPGLWAFRLADDTVIVSELETGKDGRLRITRTSAREVKRYNYAHEGVVRVNNGVKSDDVFITSISGEMTLLDWSDDVDYVSRVVSSLADMSDPRVLEIISWLERHQEVITNRVSTPDDREPALDVLRSAALANRLRVDRELMEVYLAAALRDEAVRNVVADYVKEGHGAERDKLRAELREEISAQKTRCLAQLSAEISAERTESMARIEQELEKYEADGRSECDVRLQDAEHAVSVRIQALETSASERSAQIERQIAEQTQRLMDIKAEVAGVAAERRELWAEAECARTQLADAKVEIDRLLAVAAQLDPKMISAPQHAANKVGVGRIFPNYPKVDVAAKGQLIARQVMLSEKGKDVLRSLVVMLLSGELPILVGSDTTDLLRVAESVICPGRLVSVEADPTLISLDDLWARPGSGAPTLLAAAAEAAKDGGATLVVIRGVERSGARFWLPALSEVLRSGGLPRGLFVCCTVHESEHDEVRVLRGSVPWLEITNVFSPGAALAGPSLLTPPRIELEMLDPGEMPIDLSGASSLALELGENLSLDIAMRSARMLAEAFILLGDMELAERLVLKVAKQLAMSSN